MPVFLLGTGANNTVNNVALATRGKQHRKYCGFGLPRRTKHRYLRCFCFESVKKCAKSTYLTIFMGARTTTTATATTTTTPTPTATATTTIIIILIKILLLLLLIIIITRRRTSTKMRQKGCGKMVTSCVWQEHHTVLCTCAHAQSTWTTPTLTLLYIILMASPVCEALQYWKIMEHFQKHGNTAKNLPDSSWRWKESECTKSFHLNQWFFGHHDPHQAVQKLNETVAKQPIVVENHVPWLVGLGLL